MYRFCKEYGYRMEIQSMDFGALIPSVISGKADIAGSCISITEERAKSIHFSIPEYFGGFMLVARTSDLRTEEVKSNQTAGFFTKLSQSFSNNFIKENRWKLIASGLGVIIIISLLSAFFGTILGFGICMQRRSANHFVSSLAGVFINFIQGIPVVVLLMVLYYVVFASASMSGIIIATIAFSINFGAYVSEILRSGIEAVDKGQWEASSALGFNKVKTFTKVIMPQALEHIMPVYKGEFISMEKVTSVVGYIAIQDLTRASDIIRSRTYDAFFPLIVTAFIYFFLSWGLSFLLDFIKTDSEKRTHTIKGVDMNTQISANGKEMNAENNHEEVIHVEHLKKVYANAVPLKDLNASINRGDVVTIIGPSGTGKSTFLRCLNHLEIPTEGKITVLGQDIEGPKTDLCAVREQMGMVFQSFNLFPHLTIAENIMLAPMQLKKIPRQKAYEQAILLLRKVGMAEKATNYPDELSGGQKQRVAIARTLAMDPQIILFDEPTSALDPTMVGEVLSVIHNLATQGMTMLIVTHEMKFAHDVSTRIFYLDQGIVFEEGTPDEVFLNPKKDRTRIFVKRLKVFEQHITSPDYDFIALNSALSAFGEKSMLDEKRITDMQRVFEELIAQNTIPRLGASFDIGMFVEYTQETNTIFIRFVWKGETYNPLQEADKLSLLLVKSIIKVQKYTYEGETNDLAILL